MEVNQVELAVTIEVCLKDHTGSVLVEGRLVEGDLALCQTHKGKCQQKNADKFAAPGGARGSELEINELAH